MEKAGTNFFYHADGLTSITEITNQSGSVVQRYTYSSFGEIESQQDANFVQPYTFTAREVDPEERGGQNFYYHADGLTSITDITNQSGSVVQRYSYSSFGELESQLDSNFIQPYTFTAREFDSETELYHYRERQYDWRTGRFASEDPIAFEGGINFYAYAGNNPVNFVDPLGLQQENASQCPVSRNCLKGFYDCMARCLIVPDIDPNTILSEGGQAVSFYYTARGWQHAASRGLIYPLRSSIVRGLLNMGRIAGPVGVLGSILYCEGRCLFEQAQCEGLL
jgi:RHS repeat-associated protein